MSLCTLLHTSRVGRCFIHEVNYYLRQPLPLLTFIRRALPRSGYGHRPSATTRFTRFQVGTTPIFLIRFDTLPMPPAQFCQQEKKHETTRDFRDKLKPCLWGCHFQCQDVSSRAVRATGPSAECGRAGTRARVLLKVWRAQRWHLRVCVSPLFPLNQCRPLQLCLESDGMMGD